MSDKLIAWVRTVVPALIGAGLTWLAMRLDVIVDADTSAAITTGVTALVIAGYYSAAKWLEARNPFFGWLLGSPKTPVYVNPDDAVRVNGVLRVPGPGRPPLV